MKGLELAEKFYYEYGVAMLKEQFPHLMDKIAVGLVGSGSECFGYDDEVSKDHDFEPGFCIFIPDENVVDSRECFKLERAYSKLPKEYMGYKRSSLNPVGGNRHGVIKISEFYEKKVGNCWGQLSVSAWFTLPEHYLAEATNGKVFYDGYGLFTDIRNGLLHYPADIRLKKLAGNLLLMAQTGQYNYARCIAHGDSAAAQLCVCEYVKCAINTIFLLCERYQPFYKWTFRALKELPVGDIAQQLEFLISTPNDAQMVAKKIDVIEYVVFKVIEMLKEQGLTAAVCGDLQKHAYSVNDKVSDISIRNADIFAGV